MKVSLPQHLMKPVEKWGKPAAIDISVGIADPDVGPWYSLGDRTGSEEEPHKPTNWSEPRARVLRKDEPLLTKLRQNVKSYQCNVTKIIMQTPGPGCLEKALSNKMYVNISKYPLDNDFSGGKFYPAMNKCKHKKVRISNWMTTFWTELAPVVETSDSAIHRINHYPADSVIYFRNTYPLDSDLSTR